MTLRSSIARHTAAAAIAVLVLLPQGASAAATRCPQHFPGGMAPDLANPRLGARVQELCYVGFAVLHSGITRTPLWSAEHLTPGRLRAARRTERDSEFHADSNLAPEDRAELSDYRRSGFDRGHLAPSGDMPDSDAQQESFSLANIIPQNRALNRGIWEGIESAVRDYVGSKGEVYVVTGPVFRGQTLRRINGRVLVPTDIYKAVYDPRRRQAGAYLVVNAEVSVFQEVSIARLREISGIDVFPGLPAAVRDQALDLPDPKVRGRQRRSDTEGQEGHGAPFAIAGDDPAT
ncbi:endonuclease G [Skermanella aerolata]|uniref:DNA/RNA non-specific endonuclease n=1 Tax=Skermanella aerolata TaxID=393310 RepID=UPI003D24FE32